MQGTNPVSDRRLAIDDLDQAIVTLSARIHAANYELLVLIRQFDERAGFLRWGLSSCAEWLHWRCDLSPKTAREKVRIAHALKGLPEISKAFGKGELSYSKVRALMRVANPDNEVSLLRDAMNMTAARLEERCCQLYNVRPEAVSEANRVYERRSVRVFRDPGSGTLTLTVELPIAEGEVIGQALDKAIEVNGCNGPEFESTPWCAQQADALVEICKGYLTGTGETRSGSADTYQVVVHVDAEALNAGQGRSDLPLESVRRLTCDGSVVRMTEGANSEPLSVGRKQRTVPTAIKRALWARDQGCSFPGCTHIHYVDAHHVRHWSKGGETSLENLMLLCSQHHRLVHEGGYDICKDVEGRWYFKRPDGRAIPTLGYQLEDMSDDHDAPAGASASAEALALRTSDFPDRVGRAIRM